MKNLNQEDKNELLEIYNKFITLDEQDKSFILSCLQAMTTKDEE